MTMNFNLPGEVVEVVRRVKAELVAEFYGRNSEQMPRLLTGIDAKGNDVDVPRIPLGSCIAIRRWNV